MFSSPKLKIISVLFITIGAVNLLYTQESKPNQPDDILDRELNKEQVLLKNELKLNLAYAPFGYLEASYERILPGNSSFGLALGKSIKEDIDLEYHLILFYRLFFGREDGKGFFIEANGAYWKEDFFFRENRSNQGVGLAVGGKFFRGRKFHGEFVFGYGRTLTDNSYNFDGAYPRFAISIGHRFNSI